MHTVFALLCFVVVIHWLIYPYPSGLLQWHCGNLTIAPVTAKQPWWIWINTSFEFIMNDYITTTKQSTTKPCAYFLGYTVCDAVQYSSLVSLLHLCYPTLCAESVVELDFQHSSVLTLYFNITWWRMNKHFSSQCQTLLQYLICRLWRLQWDWMLQTPIWVLVEILFKICYIIYMYEYTTGKKHFLWYFQETRGTYSCKLFPNCG